MSDLPRYIWVDRRTCIVVLGRKAVQLGIQQFAIFDTLHQASRRRKESLPTNDLIDAVYNGQRTAGTNENIHPIVHNLNKKLEHIGLKVQGTNRKTHSFYRIVPLPEKQYYGATRHKSHVAFE